MLVRLSAIVFILIATSVAWIILGATIGYRTDQSDDKLRLGVNSIWGSPEEQTPPVASYQQVNLEKVETETDGHKTTRTNTRRETVQIPLEASRINVALNLDHRQKGLLWYSTYVVDFAADYAFQNPSPDVHTVSYWLKLPAEHAIYDGLTMAVNGRSLPTATDHQGMSVSAEIGPH